MTWNPVTGCVKISKGCTHCYAERMAKRLKAMGSSRYLDGFKPTLCVDHARDRGSALVAGDSIPAAARAELGGRTLLFIATEQVPTDAVHRSAGPLFALHAT